MTFTRKLQPLMYPYSILGEVLERPCCLRDLGVTFDPKLTFVNNINDMILGAGRTLGFIVRNCKNFNESRVFNTIFFFCAFKIRIYNKGSKLVNLEPLLYVSCTKHRKDSNTIFKVFNFQDGRGLS